MNRTDNALAGGWHAPDYLGRFALPESAAAAIRTLRAERRRGVEREKFAPLRAALRALASFKTAHFDSSASVVRIGKAGELTPAQDEALDQAINAFIPWKKGPFSLFGRMIDSEWRCDLKWQRLLAALSERAGAGLTGARVADIGCNNGYYMFRMLAEDPALVVGFDPEERLYLNFQLLQGLVRDERLHFELLGVEHMQHYPASFDRIFCLGILYHHTDPVGLLRQMHRALDRGGKIIIDCQGIPGADPVALVPRQRYAGSRGTWFMPTKSCLENWIVRAGFRNVHCFFDELLTVEEQRRTAHAPIASLADFLDPNDPTRTIEGYPAPRRFYVIADK